MARVSLKDIAKELGISSASVSLVLNGKGGTSRVGKEMADKIRLKAKEMNYEPNNLARGLRLGRSQTIGLILADISNSFFAHMAFYIQEYAEKHGFNVIITNTNESDLKFGKIINMLKSRQVDGFIIVPTEHGSSYIEDLLKQKTPLVLLDRYFPDIQTSHVVVDNYQASSKAIQSLLDQHCRNIGLVIYKSELQHMLERKRGYVDTLKNWGLYNPSLVKELNFSRLSSDMSIAIESLLDSSNKVDGIFFATNSLSMIGIRELKEMNIRIPEDMKVVCFDKNDAFDFMHVPIPYIQQPIQEMGKMAVELLVEQIEHKDMDVKHIELASIVINNP